MSLVGKNTKVGKKDLKQEAESFLRFKKNGEVFATLLHSTVPATPLPSPSFALSFGAKDPKYTITAITSPSCGYCQAPFLAYYDLLELYPDSLRLEVVFSVPYTHADNLATQVAISIINLYQKDPAAALEAAKAWYKHRDEANWMAQYGNTETNEATTQQLAASMDWCSANDYRGTLVRNARNPAR